MTTYGVQLNEKWTGSGSEVGRKWTRMCPSSWKRVQKSFKGPDKAINMKRLSRNAVYVFQIDLNFKINGTYLTSLRVFYWQSQS